MSFLQPSGTVIDLGVNIDHIATVRNARGTVYPDPLRAALLAEQAGADVITLHLREDRRHIKDADVLAMRPELMTRMNLEAAVTQEMIDFACRVKPHWGVVNSTIRGALGGVSLAMLSGASTGVPA